jgi:DNA invertase Pin-like site-specific DNA recombinase
MLAATPSTTKPLRAARYMRISTKEQSTALQVDETLEFISRRGWRLQDTFEDTGISGTKDKRPELDRMMKAARARKFDVLVVYRSDRLFRSMRHMVLCLEELAALGIDFVSVTEPFDMTTPTGRLLLHLVSAFASFERDVLVSRVHSGLEAAKRRGKVLGRPGLRLNPLEVQQMKGRGMSVRQIAKTLGTSPTNVHRALQAGVPNPPSQGPLEVAETP